MTPIKFDGFNALYKPTTDGPQVDMPAKRDGKIVVTRWLPSPDELQCLAHGGAVELTVFGGLPPVDIRVV